MVTVKGSIKRSARPKFILEAVVRKYIRLFDITEHDAFGRAQWREQVHVVDPN